MKNMRPVLLYVLLLSGCSYIRGEANYRIYELSWTCLSPEGCERADVVVPIDRAEIVNGSDRVLFMSSRDGGFREAARLVDMGDLPADCSWLYSLTLFAHELEPSRFCRTENGFELEVAIPNRDSTTHSQWLIEGEHIGP
jgi:hypothetical protein